MPESGVRNVSDKEFHCSELGLTQVAISPDENRKPLSEGIPTPDSAYSHIMHVRGGVYTLIVKFMVC